MKILVTGAAGFIGFHVVKKLLKKKIFVVGIDNFNKYYDPNLKLSRYKELLKINNKFKIHKIDLKDFTKVKNLFKKNKFDIVVNLAAQAGVRYSIDNPDSYFESNVVGFYNILKNCKTFKIRHLIAASSSSIYGEYSYGATEDISTSDKPLQFYAATKKSNEVMAHSFSNIYKTPVSMVRFFTVYGPWGRPDMSLFNFTDRILRNKSVKLYNRGNHIRDYTYVDDVVNAVVKLIYKKPKNKKVPFEVYNLGNEKGIYLKDFLNELIKQLKIKPKITLLKRQHGDVLNTLSNTKKIKKLIGHKSKTNYKKGISLFLSWYKNYYKIKV